MADEEVIPQDRFGPFVRPFTTITLSEGATGVSVDSSGKIWAGCWDSDTAVRIDPNAGPLVVLEGQTSHVGLLDMMVDLSNGSWYPDPYTDLEAHPYNYSDMTGFNTRVVNPGLKPLKGYWIAINDSGNAGQLWNRLSWSNSLPSGCSIEVYARAADDRNGLGSEVFVPVTNNVSFPQIRGRYVEVRLAMTRDDPSKQPLLYDLTLSGISSGFAGNFFLYDQWPDEGSDAVFLVNLVGAEPMSYQWFVQYPWTNQMVLVPSATNSTFAVTSVDSWVDLTQVSCLVSNGNGDTIWLGPAYLEVVPVTIRIPAANYGTGQGPATRYPATINVFDQPANLISVTVTLWGLSHTRSADISILLVSPSNKGIMLMSNVGGASGVSDASLSFRQAWSQPVQADPIPSGGPWPYGPSNYGQVNPMPQLGTNPPPDGPYSINLDDLKGDDPNGHWRLYIYDRYQGGVGQLSGSWQLNFKFQ